MKIEVVANLFDEGLGGAMPTIVSSRFAAFALRREKSLTQTPLVANIIPFRGTYGTVRY